MSKRIDTHINRIGWRIQKQTYARIANRFLTKGQKQFYRGRIAFQGIVLEQYNTHRLKTEAYPKPPNLYRI